VISDTSTIVAAGDLLASTFGDEVVVLNLRDGVYYTLDEVAARIWTLIGTPVRVPAICDAIAAEYDVEADRCERDIRTLLETLASHGLVHIS